MDSALRWDKHISKVNSRVKRLIHVFKTLRDSATMKQLRFVYLALCQSIIQYCITVWRGAANTHLSLERAQRAVLESDGKISAVLGMEGILSLSLSLCFYTLIVR